MAMPRYNARRDDNESPLIRIAEQLGWWLHKSNELTDYIGWRRGAWHLIEIKNPDCEGHADEFTSKQKLFHAEAFKRGANVLIWRTSDDVVRDSNSRVSA